MRVLDIPAWSEKMKLGERANAKVRRDGPRSRQIRRARDESIVESDLKAERFLRKAEFPRLAEGTESPRAQVPN